jgi:hypothetical protein
MKHHGVFILAAVIIIMAAGYAAAQEKPWFDMTNCSLCKELTKDPKLMDNMTWEHYDLSNGLLVLTTVKPEFKESYLKAQEGMNKVAAQMGQGTPVQMCGHCQAFGMLMMSGVKMESVSTSAGDIVLMTTDKPEILEQIRAYGNRTRTELAKMEAEKKK